MNFSWRLFFLGVLLFSGLGCSSKTVTLEDNNQNDNRDPADRGTEPADSDTSSEFTTATETARPLDSSTVTGSATDTTTSETGNTDATTDEQATEPLSTEPPLDTETHQSSDPAHTDSDSAANTDTETDTQRLADTTGTDDTGTAPGLNTDPDTLSGSTDAIDSTSHADDDTSTATQSTTDTDTVEDTATRSTDTETGPLPPLAFTVNATLSPVIATVGIVTWSVNRPIQAARIEFGPDTSYGMIAPVDLTQPDYRTLLLGMKASSESDPREYHFRIVATYDTDTYVSDDNTIVTGPIRNGLPEISITDEPGAELAGGFTVTPLMAQNTAVIIDADGEFVWWYPVPAFSEDGIQMNRARMTHDGQYMLMGAINVRNSQNGEIVKVSMDGLIETIIDVPDRHHDFTVLPDDETIAYIEFDENGEGLCDRIVEIDAAGNKTQVYTIRQDFPYRGTTTEWCHSNAIDYVPSQNAYYLSVLMFDSILKIDRETGTLVWELGGQESDFSGAEWRGQHQHHVLEDSILFFNNFGEAGGLAPSRGMEYALDETTWDATPILVYSRTEISRTLGDIQRLSNGNTMITFSNAGAIHELDPDGVLIRDLNLAQSGAFGYAIRRPSLYGPPPEYAD